MRRGAVVGAAVVGVVALGATATALALSPSTDVPDAAPSASGTPSPEPDATARAAAFLDEWVDDGRVVRRDEGGDTVSEGQAYGMLAAVAAGDEVAFDEIWTWTEENLIRADGLLSWRWNEGAVVDAEPASDADLDAARALVLAGDRFDRPDLAEAGDELGDAVLDLLTAQTAHGRVLLPGLWAADRVPVPYNPSYASPAAYDILADASDDARWQELADGSRAVTAAILDTTALPPDWAQIREDGGIDPMPGPFGGGDRAEYSFDAPRLVIRYAESCDPADTALAARMLPALSYMPEPASHLDLGGGALSAESNPLGLAARGAAKSTSGDAAGADEDLARAVSLGEEYPTYYGSAWVALSAAMLMDDVLGGCPPMEGRS